MCSCTTSPTYHKSITDTRCLLIGQIRGDAELLVVLFRWPPPGLKISPLWPAKALPPLRQPPKWTRHWPKGRHYRNGQKQPRGNLQVPGHLRGTRKRTRGATLTLTLWRQPPKRPRCRPKGGRSRRGQKPPGAAGEAKNHPEGASGLPGV